MVLYVAETAHKYKNIGQSVFKGRVCFTLRTRNVWEQTKEEEEASRQIMNFSRSDLIQSGRDAAVSRRGNKQNWEDEEDEVVLQSLRTSEDPHKPEAHILLRVPLCASLRDSAWWYRTIRDGREERITWEIRPRSLRVLTCLWGRVKIPKVIQYSPECTESSKVSSSHNLPGFSCSNVRYS